MLTMGSFQLAGAAILQIKTRLLLNSDKDEANGAIVFAFVWEFYAIVV